MRPLFQLRVAALSLALVAAALAWSGMPALGQPASEETVVSQDTTWSGRDVAVQDLVVRAPATLRLEGTSLHVGGHVLVEAGATLEAGPLNGRPSSIGPAQAGAPSEFTGFWMTVEGNLSTRGTPATELHGIRGTGLNNLYNPGGGIQVMGRVVLEDAHVHDGNSSLMVRQSGSLVLRNTTVEDMGFLNLGAFGQVELEASTLKDATNGIMALNTCSLRVHDSRIEATLNGISLNGCRLDLQRSTMIGAINGLYMSNAANASVADTTFTEYTQHGIFVRGYSTKEELKPRLVAERLLLDPKGAQGSGAYDGLTVQTGIADVSASVIRGNTGYGILGKDSAMLRLHNVTVIRNNFGMFAQGSFIDGDMLHGNDFGDPDGPDANTLGQVAATIFANAVVRDQNEQLLPNGTLKVFDRNGNQLGAETSNGTALVRVIFPAYLPNADASSSFLGPFTYELSHPAMSEPSRGTLDLSHPYIIGSTFTTAPHLREGSANPWVDTSAIVLLAVAGLLMLAGVLWRPMARRIRGRRARSK